MTIPADRGAGSVRLATWLRQIVEPMDILADNRSLTLLILGFAGVTMAEWGYVTALAIYAFRQNGPEAVGLVGFRLFFAAVGTITLAPYIVRVPGRRALAAIALGRAVIVGLTFLLAATHAPLAPLLVLVGVDAVFSAPYRPAQAAVLPALARTPQELAASAAALSTAKTVAQAVGASAGGFLLLVITPADVFGGAAGIFALVGLATARFLPSLSTATDPRHVRLRELLADTVRVIRLPHVGGIVAASGLRTFVRGMWVATAVIASLRLLHAGSAGVGLLMLAAGVGTLIAVPLSAALIGRTHVGGPAAVALIACGLPLGVIAGIPVLDVALVLVAAWGIGMAVADVSLLSLLYRLITTPSLPRAVAVMEAAKLALEGLGALVAPTLAATIGVRGALLAAAAPLPIVVLAGWRALRRVDEVAGRRTELISLLHRLPLFETLDIAALELLASRATRVAVGAGTEVVRQGDEGDRYYVVEVGSADVLVNGFYVGEVGVGDGFGEKALLREVPRTATVRTREATRLFALTRSDFLTAITGTDEPGAIAVATPHPGEGAEWGHRTLLEVLSKVSLFSHLDGGSLSGLAARATVERWPEATTLVHEGEEGDRFFVVLEGHATVSLHGEPVAELRPGDQFGEIALLHDVPRTADVMAATSLTTLSLHRHDFVAAVRSRVLRG